MKTPNSIQPEKGVYYLYAGDEKYISPILMPIGTTDAGFAHAMLENNVASYLSGKNDDELRSLILADYQALSEHDPFVWGPIDKEDYDEDEAEEYEQEKKERVEMSLELLSENIQGWSREQLISFLNAIREYGSYGFVEQIGYGAVHDIHDDLDLQTYEFALDMQDTLSCALDEDVKIVNEVHAALADYGYFLSPDIRKELEKLHLL